MGDGQTRLIFLTLSFCLTSLEASPPNREKTDLSLTKFRQKSQTSQSIPDRKEETLRELGYNRSLEKRINGRCTCPDGGHICACARGRLSPDDLIPTNGQNEIPDVPVGIHPLFASIFQEQEEQAEGRTWVVRKSPITQEQGSEQTSDKRLVLSRQ
ncbi:uncharacterized protein LOC134278554 [Saccostrea cucullata]|uniref:uncharacterized protein LOC134278554 n=1 Tax=Saccostrea cuccullata TaxID=36930 RepID=UPI002ED5C6E3